MPSKIEILRARARSFKSTLQNASVKEKEGLAGTALAENFNKIVEETAQTYPDLKESLPARITSRSPFARMGKSDVSYLDLEVLADQLLAMLDLADDE